MLVENAISDQLDESSDGDASFRVYTSISEDRVSGLEVYVGKEVRARPCGGSYWDQIKNITKRQYKEVLGDGSVVVLIPFTGKAGRNKRAALCSGGKAGQLYFVRGSASGSYRETVNEVAIEEVATLLPYKKIVEDAMVRWEERIGQPVTN